MFVFGCVHPFQHVLERVPILFCSFVSVQPFWPLIDTVLLLTYRRILKIKFRTPLTVKDKVFFMGSFRVELIKTRVD